MNLVNVTKTFLIGASISLFSTISAFASTGIITQENVDVYSNKSIDSILVGKLDKDAKVTVVSNDNDWIRIEFEGFEDAFIPKQYISIEETEKTNAIVTDENVNVRQQPSLDAAIIGKTDKDENIVVKAKVGEWYELDYNGIQAYIFGEYVKGDFLAGMFEDKTQVINKEPEVVKELEIVKEPEVAMQQEVAQNPALGQKIVEYAKQFIGTPYVYGGSSLTKGTDCSGFTSSVMRNFGINLSRSSRQQINNGKRVDKSQLVAGDLVFFNPGGGSISHVGLYIGNGNFIHSSSVRTGGVIISNLNEAYYKNTYFGASRVL